MIRIRDIEIYGGSWDSRSLASSDRAMYFCPIVELNYYYKCNDGNGISSRGICEHFTGRI